MACAFVALLLLSSGASAAAWVTQSAPGPALVANGDLVSVSCLPPAPCVAVGSFVSASGADRPLIEIRRGRRWSIQEGPVPPSAGDTQLSAVACPAKRSCIAVGFSVLAGGREVTLAVRWNGSSWSILRTVNPIGAGGRLSALSCPSARFCMAVGSGPGGALFERWNGSRWSLQHPAGLGARSQLDGVSCPSRRACLAVGATGRGAVAELWNGRRWSRFGRPQGVSVLKAISCTSPQACSAISDTDTVYAVQRWNEQRWTTENVAPPACDPADALCSNVLLSIACVSPSACYLAGEFDVAAEGSSGMETGTPIAEFWDGSRWRSERVPDVGVAPNINEDAVYGTSLNGISCTARSACVTVGTASTEVGGGQPLIEHRNAGAWSVQPAPSPLGPAPSQLSAVSCSSATACTAVGSYTDASGASFLLAERWNGATWTIQPTPGAGRFNGVSCPSATACMAVGTGVGTNDGAAVAETWTGATWSSLQTPAAGDLTAVSCTSATACLAVGAGSGGSALAESWNGATWTVQPGAGGGLWVGLSCVSADACLAARGDPTAGIADSWDGTSWTALPLPQSQLNALNPFYSAVSCSALNTCTVVINNQSITGSFETGFQSSVDGLALRWDGAAWSTQTIQLPAGDDVNTIGGVSCPSATTCTAVGSYSFTESNSPEMYGPLLERWDGTSWSAAQPPPYPYQFGSPQLFGVSCASAATCIAVGERVIIIPDGLVNSGYLHTVPYVASYS